MYKIQDWDMYLIVILILYVGKLKGKPTTNDTFGTSWKVKWHIFYEKIISAQMLNFLEISAANIDWFCYQALV